MQLLVSIFIYATFLQSVGEMFLNYKAIKQQNKDSQDVQSAMQSNKKQQRNNRVVWLHIKQTRIYNIYNIIWAQY